MGKGNYGRAPLIVVLLIASVASMTAAAAPDAKETVIKAYQKSDHIKDYHVKYIGNILSTFQARRIVLNNRRPA